MEKLKEKDFFKKLVSKYKGKKDQRENVVNTKHIKSHVEVGKV